MTIKEQVLEFFLNNKGIYLSGSDIAEKLYVTRASVWKAVKTLQSDGYNITAVTNKGYCYSDSNDILSAVGIVKYLENKNSEYDIEVFKEVDSTNTQLRKKADAGAPDGTVIISAAQTLGRGRMGRSFYSPSDSGVYMSILLRPQIDATDAVFITTAAAVAVCEAIREISGKNPQIKWVNDIFVDGRKVCGILTEASFDIENGKVQYVILGIGVNVYSPEENFPEEIKNIAGFIFEKRSEDIRNRLSALILAYFSEYKDNLKERNFVPLYKKYSFVIGRDVKIISGEKTTPAHVLDIDDECRLVVRFNDGRTEALSSGEISIRL